MNDSIIKEIRAVRDEYARQFNYDLHAMCEDLREGQRKSESQIVKLPKRLPKDRVIETEAVCKAM